MRITINITKSHAIIAIVLLCSAITIAAVGDNEAYHPLQLISKTLNNPESVDADADGVIDKCDHARTCAPSGTCWAESLEVTNTISANAICIDGHCITDWKQAVNYW